MGIIFQIGTILFWPFTHFLIGEIVWLISIVVMIILAKKRHVLKNTLLWWLLPILFLILLFRVIGGGRGGFMGAEGRGIYNVYFDFSIVLLWFLYYPILKAIYLFSKSLGYEQKVV